MLHKKRCPFTGVLNFYGTDDAYLAVGSIVRRAGPARYEWRIYDPQADGSGVATDLKAAERSLRAWHSAQSATRFVA